MGRTLPIFLTLVLLPAAGLAQTSTPSPEKVNNPQISDDTVTSIAATDVAESGPASNTLNAGMLPNDRYAYEFQERQYVVLSPNEIVQNDRARNLMFEAQIALHLPMFYWRITPDRDVREHASHELRVIFVFGNYVRMLTSESAPVITPSYMPGIRIQWLARRIVMESGSTLNFPKYDFRYGLSLVPFQHHSNGQDGCTLQSPNPVGLGCPTPGDANALNEIDGSFSTNWAELMFHFRGSWKLGHTRESMFNERRFSIIDTTGIQYHYNNFLPGGLDPLLKKLWGKWHLNNSLEFRFRPGRLNPAPKRLDDSFGERFARWLGFAYVKWDLDVLIDGGEDKRMSGVSAPRTRNIWELGFFPNIKKVLGWGFYARVIQGREYYNIQFTQNVTRFQAGLVYNSFGKIVIPKRL